MPTDSSAEARRRAGRPARQPRGRWSAEIRARFLALLTETGNARACYRALGHENMFRKRKRIDAAFRADWEAAVDEADARWRGAENAFPHVSAAPPAAHPRPLPQAGGEGDGEAHAGPQPGGAAGTDRAGRDPRETLTPGPSPASGRGKDGDLGGYLRPGRKRRASRPQAVIRRTSNGRWQLGFAREGHWTEEIEADFLARLRLTGNFSACALAVGFQPASVHQRARKWAGFEQACTAALREASIRLDHRLIAEASNLLGGGDAAEEAGTGASNCRHVEEEAEAAGTGASNRPHVEEGTVTGNCPQIPFDAEAAMRILGFLDRRAAGRTTRGRKRGPPDLAIEDAVESILAKIEAIERHERLLRELGRAAPE